MPGWSDEIANEFIQLALADGRAFDQMHLQELVYIAHGWCLAMTGQPLTGDRPAAREHGPEYRRLADALACWGVRPVTREIRHPDLNGSISRTDQSFPGPELSSAEHDLLNRTYTEYGDLKTGQLALLTRAPGTPWEHVFADGSGEGRDISHQVIRAQFEQVAKAIQRGIASSRA